MDDIVGKVAIRWVRTPDGGTEYQILAEGRPQDDPRWAAGELQHIAMTLATRGWGFHRSVPDPNDEQPQRLLSAGRGYQITGPDQVVTEMACTACGSPTAVQVILNGRGVLEAIAAASEAYRCNSCAVGVSHV